MNFFNINTPIFQRKLSAFAIDDMPGLWRVHWQIGDIVLWSSFYTQHDQACMLWGCVSAAIFVTAQFVALSWTAQAILASIFTVVGLAGMVNLTWYFTKLDRLSWVLYGWIALMIVGMGLTDAGIFLHWGDVLLNLCPLWLGLSAIGYLLTGVIMQSRTFIVFGLVHLLAICALPHVGAWQQLTTGIVISSSVLLMAELQWDANGVCGYQSEQDAIDPTQLNIARLRG